MVVVMAAINPVASQCTWPCRIPNSSMMSCRATLTTVALSTVAMVPSMTVATASQRQRSP